MLKIQHNNFNEGRF